MFKPRGPLDRSRLNRGLPGFCFPRAPCYNGAVKLRHELAAGAGLLLLFLGLVLTSLPRHSPTVDEFAHLPAGYYYLRTGDFKLYPNNPPLIKLIAALPWLYLRPALAAKVSDEQHPGWLSWLYGASVMRLNAARYQRLFDWGRVPITGLALLLGLSIWHWSRRLYGPAGGLISLTCFCLCPNFLAHSGLVTTDVGASLFIFLALRGGLRFLERATWTRGLTAGLLLGLAQLAKFSSFFLVPIFLSMPLWAGRWQRWAFAEKGQSFSYPGFVRAWALLGLTAWLVLCAGYGFQWDPYAFSRFPFLSATLQSAQKRLPASLPVPLPYSYLDGIDFQLHDIETGENPNYLLGEWYRGQKWDYFPVALAVKTPLPILLGFGLALGLNPHRQEPAKSKRRRRPAAQSRRFSPEEWALLLVLVAGYLSFTLRNNLQIGVRYLLPLFPLGYVLMGRLAAWPGFSDRAGRWYSLLLAGLGLWLLIGTLRIYPHFLAYFNELAGGPDRGYKILLDSNLDWGQDLPGLAAYLKEHQIQKVHLAYFGHADPAIYGIDYDLLQKPGQPGLTAISANYLFGFPYPVTYTDPWSEIPPAATAPYRQRQPLAKIGYSIFLFQD